MKIGKVTPIVTRENFGARYLALVCLFGNSYLRPLKEPKSDRLVYGQSR